MAAPACFSVKNAPRRLMSITRSHSDAGRATTGPTVPVPAEATQCWRPPVASLATSTARATSSSWATSHATLRTSAPSGASACRSATAAVEPLLAPPGERDRRAVAQQVARRRQPDAAAAAGDQPGRAGQDELAHLHPPRVGEAVTLGGDEAARSASVAASAGAASRWAAPGTSSTKCTGGPLLWRVTVTSPRGQVPTVAVGPGHAELARRPARATTRSGHAVALTLEVADETAEPPEARRHRDEPGVVHPPCLDPRPGHGRSLAAVGTDRLPRTLVPMKATSGDLPDGRGVDLRGEVGRHARARLRRRRRSSACSPTTSATSPRRGPSWPGLPDALPATHRAARRRAGGHRRRGPPELRAAPAAHARHRARSRWRPAPPRCPSPTWCSTCSTSTATTCATSRCPIGAGSSTRCSSPGPRWRVSPLHDDGPALLEAATGTRARGRRGQAARLPLRARQAHPDLAEGEGAAPPGDGGGRLAPRRGQPHRPHRRAARRLPRRGRRRRAAAVRGTGRHGLQGRRAHPAGAAVRRAGHRRVPVRPAAAARRDPARPSLGATRSWWPSSSSASGPTTTGCATRATSACATTRPPRT